MPCAGRGKVISKLGGTPAEVTCPWCSGSGVRATGVDAQARWAVESAEHAAAPGTAAVAASAEGAPALGHSSDGATPAGS